MKPISLRIAGFLATLCAWAVVSCAAAVFLAGLVWITDASRDETLVTAGFWFGITVSLLVDLLTDPKDQL